MVDTEVITLKFTLSPATTAFITFGGIIPTREDFARLRQYLDIAEESLNVATEKREVRQPRGEGGRFVPAVNDDPTPKKDNVRPWPPCEKHPEATIHPRTGLCGICNRIRRAAGIPRKHWNQSPAAMARKINV